MPTCPVNCKGCFSHDSGEPLSAVSIRQLKTLIAVHDRGSFSAAADVVSVTQAAISQQMQALEADWGVALFDRRGRPVLTPAGQDLVARARSVVAGYDALRPATRGEGVLNGSCRLGSVPTGLVGLVPLAVRLLADSVPQLQLNIVSGLSHTLMDAVLQGRLDLALVSRQRVLDPGIQWHAVADEPLELIAPPDCADQTVETLLRERPFIRFARDAVVGELIEAWLQQRGIEVQERMVVEELQATANLVLSTRGVSIVPRQCVDTVPAPAVCRLPLGPDAPVRHLGLVCRNAGQRTAIVDAVVDGVRRAVSQGRLHAD